jgi:hypothetical protein
MDPSPTSSEIVGQRGLQPERDADRRDHRPGGTKPVGMDDMGGLDRHAAGSGVFFEPPHGFTEPTAEQDADPELPISMGRHLLRRRIPTDPHPGDGL